MDVMLALKRSRMFIFDPCFGNFTGHWENYCKRLCAELAERGYEITVFGQSVYKPEIVNGVNFIPIFKQSPFSPIKTMLDFNRSAKLFLQDFKSIDELYFRDGDIFMFHSIYPQIFSAILDWSGDIIKRKKIVNSIVLQFSPSEIKANTSSIKLLYYYCRKKLSRDKTQENKSQWADNNYVRFYQKAIENIEEKNKNYYVFFATAEVLSRNFTDMLGVKVNYLPMPGEINQDLSKPIAPSNNKIKIGYFGHSSLEKGGQFLKYIVDQTTKDFCNVEFVLHINPNPDTEVYLDYFKKTTFHNVTCYHGHLEQKQIMRLMSEVDILLMPYAPSKYATTPSAIFTEGMPLKKVFVLSKNTWAYDEAIKYNAGYTSFNRYTESSIYKAIRKALMRFEGLKHKSEKAGELFHRENNIKNYVTIYENNMKAYL